jgi:tRNA A-37 threonylcarbamoyl transferase component Bud32
MSVLTRSRSSEVKDLGNSISKTFSCPYLFNKEIYVYTHFPGIAPKLITINYDKYELILEKLHTWREKQLTPEEQKKVLSSLINKLKFLWDNQYIHGDVHMDNIVFNDNFEAFLIDFEWFQHRISDIFLDDIDFKPHTMVSALDGSYRSVKSVLNTNIDEIMRLLQ